jgi:glutathione S-transferase
MSDSTLIITNKNYSSWSLRPWIMMRHAEIPFTESLVVLFSDRFREKVRGHPGAGKAPGQVPVLLDDGEAVWGSLAILEYLAEKFPDRGLWPADMMMRAKARSGAGEMHSGFSALRAELPMNIRLDPKAIPLSDDVMADAARIEDLWAECLARKLDGGPFLFGAFGNIDAMYAPVVNRLHVYKVPVTQTSRAYMDAVMALPAWQEWEAAARDEPWEFEIYVR